MADTTIYAVERASSLCGEAGSWYTSTACMCAPVLQIAKWLGAPVALVVDCWSMARSAAALVKGYAEFDPGKGI